jgi:hypothetical protein
MAGGWLQGAKMKVIEVIFGDAPPFIAPGLSRVKSRTIKVSAPSTAVPGGREYQLPVNCRCTSPSLLGIITALVRDVTVLALTQREHNCHA